MAADTYVATLVFTDEDAAGATLTVARTAGTNCDEFELIYRNIHPTSLLGTGNIFYLYFSESTLVSDFDPAVCICVSASDVI